MLQGNYEQIIQLISENSGISVEDIERRIEARRAKLSGLISKEGAAQIIASELGVNFDRQKLKIGNLLTGMKKVNVTGKVLKVNRIIEYNKNGRSGKIGSLVIADETSNIRVVLWDTNHIQLLEKSVIKEGDVIDLSGGDVRNSELHLTGFADVKLSQTTFNNIQDKPVVHKKPIDQMTMNDNISTRAFVVQIFGPTFYTVCPECNKRVFENNECVNHGIIVPKKNAILTLIIDDGSGNTRAVLFNEQIRKIAEEKEIENVEAFAERRKNLLGTEVLLEGSVRKNKLSENLEIFVSDISEVDLDKLITELEA